MISPPLSDATGTHFYHTDATDHSGFILCQPMWHAFCICTVETIYSTFSSGWVTDHHRDIDGMRGETGDERAAAHIHVGRPPDDRSSKILGRRGWRCAMAG